jgi:hypothetical protein
MTAEAAALHGFAYGEDLDPVHRRSLGYRLLAPAEPEPWAAEVEALARRLQAAPYPDHWPPTELFCSVLLSDGRRLVALARYGLADQTAEPRRGGLELVGVVGPGGLGVPSALALYRWLRQRRSAADDLRALGGRHLLSDVLAAVPPLPLPADPVPVLPIRVWQEGALLFAATVPSDPDHHLRLLEQGAADNWQWLPLVGADFPLGAYAKRGPLIAWAPHLAGVAVKLGQSQDQAPQPADGWRRPLAGALALVFLALLAANLWALRTLANRVEAARPTATDEHRPTQPEAAQDASAKRFAQALQRLLQKQGAVPPEPSAARFNELAAADKDLRLAGPDGREVAVAMDLLARHSPEKVEALVRQALDGKGYDPQLVDLVCRKVREQLSPASERGASAP